MSNKYPVMLDLEVASNINGASPVDPEITGARVFSAEEITVENPVGDQLIIHFPQNMIGQEVTIESSGSEEIRVKKIKTVKDTEMKLNCSLPPGIYTLKITGHHNVAAEIKITKS